MRSLILCATLSLATLSSGADWPQFLGPGGKATSAVKLPDTWSDTENILWKTPLQGKGASSPVVIGNKIFLTYGVGGADDLVRHIVCVDAVKGDIIWDKTVESVLPEQGKIREDHGHCSATPVATATHLYVFFGISGVFCFDHAGKQIWNTKVGSELNGWGSAASPVLHKDLLLVNACVESESLVALNAKTGKEVWRAEGIKECWHAPVLATGKGGATEVIMALGGTIKSFNADSGQELWSCKTGITWYICPQPVVQDGVLYVVGGRSGVGGVAVKLGGSGDVTASHRVWQLQKGTNVPSPVIHDGHLYYAHQDMGMAHCVNLKSGEFVYSERMDPNPSQVYASPVLSDGKIYYVGRGGQTVVVKAAPTFEVVSSAKLENGRGVFNASPAVHGNRLLLRSNKFLYCIGAK